MGFVGNAIWSILAFVLHQCFVRQDPGNGIHHEIQLILRNSNKSFNATWEFIRLAWHCRKSSIVKPLALSLVAFLCAAGSVVAGIESSKITAGVTAANDVRLKPENCGQSVWDPDGVKNQLSFGTWLTKTGRDARTYVETCYGNSSIQEGPGNCAKFPVEQISYYMSTGEQCPFADGMCLTGPNTAFKLDTNYIDSHKVLGINAPVSDRISIRKLATCSVLQSSDYSNSTTTKNSDGTVWKRHNLWFGPYSPEDYTYQYSDSAAVDGFGYELMTTIYNPGEYNVWFPIPELNRTDADVIIYVISANGLSYVDTVDDPLYSAHLNDTLPNGTPFFRADNLYQVMGCAEQYQICGSGSVTTCTSVNARWHVLKEFRTIGLNPAQTAVADLFMNITANANMFSSSFGLGTAALLARDVVFDDLMSQALPANQWQLEASNLFAISLARIQSFFVDFTSKSSNFPMGQSLAPATADQQQYICAKQTIRNLGGYESFTAAGIFTIIGAGLLLLVLSWSLDSIIGFMREKLDWHYYSIGQWRSDSWKGERTIEQPHQRIGTPSTGTGVWSNGYEGVPLTHYEDVYSNSRRNVSHMSHVSGHSSVSGISGMPPSYWN